MRDDPPNPYRNLPLGELADAMSQRAGQLLKGEAVTRRDIAHLLIAAAVPLRPMDGHARPPAKRLEDSAGVDQVFGTLYVDQAKGLRYYIYKLAADALGLRPPHDDKTLYSRLDALSDMAQRDDAGLHEALRRLEALRPAKAAAPGCRPSS